MKTAIGYTGLCPEKPLSLFVKLASERPTTARGITAN
jgi:hypothetical protein